MSLSLDGTADQAIRIAVEDASKIDEAAAQAVFEPFGSAALLRDGPEAYGRADEGLALYLARQIARAHGGELVLDPCGYDTTRFVATLPRRA